MKRIGILYPNTDPTSPANWSGTPSGLSEGFRILGMEVVPIPCNMPQLVRLPVALLSRIRGARGTVAHREPIYAMARSIVMANTLHQAGALDAIVAMGTDMYDLSHVMSGCSVPVATYDDGNFTLFLRYKDSDLHRSGFPITVVERWARRQALACQSATLVCVSTPWAKKSAVEDFGLPESKVHVVGMGHRPRSVLSESRDWATPHFLFVGVEWGRKNGKSVIDAFARVHECIPNATLDLVGEHPEIDQPGVTGHGFLHRESRPAQDLLDELFARATAFVLPSLFDPSPIAYLEAASAGLPVIATTCGGAGELLQDAAISVDPYDHEALVAAMFKLVDSNVAQSMGARAAARAAESTWQSVASRILDGLQCESVEPKIIRGGQHLTM
jgi:glycosyltransferase involved in cell wall biosynthesis